MNTGEAFSEAEHKYAQSILYSKDDMISRTLVTIHTNSVMVLYKNQEEAWRVYVPIAVFETYINTLSGKNLVGAIVARVREHFRGERVIDGIHVSFRDRY